MTPRITFKVTRVYPICTKYYPRVPNIFFQFGLRLSVHRVYIFTIFPLLTMLNFTPFKCLSFRTPVIRHAFMECVCEHVERKFVVDTETTV